MQQLACARQHQFISFLANNPVILKLYFKFAGLCGETKLSLQLNLMIIRI